MKVYAEYFKEDGLIFRTNTILQFGDSWELIGNIVLANPGSAEPISTLTPNIEENLKDFYDKYKNDQVFKKTNWHEFKADQTMHRIEKIFNGGYINENLKLNGVIQLFNTFNIKNQDLEQAITQIDTKSTLLFSIGIERYFHDKPTYFGFSNDVLNNNILNPIAKNIFENTNKVIKEIYEEEFEKNKFYHPTYINRAVNQNHFQWYKNDILGHFFNLIALNLDNKRQNMSEKKLYNISLLSSSELNDKSTLEKFTDKILDFLKEKMPEHSEVIIGNLKNGALIEFLKDNQININVKRQHPNSMNSSNKRYIKESDIALFLHYNESENIQSFIDYTKKLENKTYHILELKD